MTGKHIKETSKWKRKILGIPVIGWILGLSATALAAIGFIVILSFSGTVDVGEEINISYKQTGTHTVVSEDLADCTVAYLSGDQLALSAVDVYPNGTCTISTSLEAGTGEDARLQGIEFADPDITGTVAQCGLTAVAGGAAVTAQFTITFGTGLTPGETITFGAGDGLEWVAAPIYDAGGCTQTS